MCCFPGRFGLIWCLQQAQIVAILELFDAEQLIPHSCVSNSPRKLSQPLFNLTKTSWWTHGPRTCICSAIWFRIHPHTCLQNSYHCISHRSRSITSPHRFSSSFPRRATAAILCLRPSSKSSRIWTLPSTCLASSNCCMVLTMILFGQTWICPICNHRHISNVSRNILNR